MGAVMYGNPLNPLVPVPYPPYLWPHISGLFLPYSPALLHRPPESQSPERASSAENGYTPDKTKSGKFLAIC